MMRREEASPLGLTSEMLPAMFAGPLLEPTLLKFFNLLFRTWRAVFLLLQCLTGNS